MSKLEDLKAQRTKTLEDMEKINAKDSLDADQEAQFSTLQAQFDKLDRDIKLESMKNVLAADVDDVLVASSQLHTVDAEYQAGFDNYLAGINLSDAKAAMTEGVDSDGGYTVPESYQKTVAMKLNSLSATRSISSVISTTSTTNIPTEGDAPTFAWISEGGEYGQTGSTFGRKILNAYKLGGIIKVSREFLQDTAINFDNYMAGQIARGIDKAESSAFTTGDGSGKPTGYLTTATVGANSTTAATDGVTADELIDMYYDLKEEYRKSATWRMTDKTEKAIRKLKDNDGNYLYGAGLTNGERATLLGRPIVIDNSMPDLGAGNKFIIFGDFSYFQIADRGNMTIQRLDELYAGTGMVGFQVTTRVDAKTIIEEAFNAGQNASE